jgi:hypothetical protein
MKKRALERYERDKARDVGAAATKFQQELIAIAGLERLAVWLAKKRIALKIKKTIYATFHDDKHEVHLSGGLSRQKQLIILIHECGHVLVGHPKRTERFGMTEILAGERCTFRHRLDVLEEEFEAWHRGKKLAKRLKITYDNVLWDEFKVFALVSYLKWAVGDRAFNDGDYSDMRQDPDVKKRRRRVQDHPGRV